MFLDIAFGILAAIFTGHIFNFEPTIWWIILGALFALLPDIDVTYELATRGWKVGGNVLGGHREWTHYPLLYPIVIAIAYAIWGAPVATLLGMGIFWHVIHDSVSIGWGIQWLAPFSHTHYKFFAKQEDGSFTWNNFMVAWPQGEVQQVVAKHGDPNWIRNLYLRPTLTSVTEFLGFVATAIFLYLYLR